MPNDPLVSLHVQVKKPEVTEKLPHDVHSDVAF